MIRQRCQLRESMMSKRSLGSEPAMKAGRKKYLEERARHRAKLARRREEASILDVLPKSTETE